MDLRSALTNIVTPEERIGTLAEDVTSLGSVVQRMDPRRLTLGTTIEVSQSLAERTRGMMLRHSSPPTPDRRSHGNRPS